MKRLYIDRLEGRYAVCETPERNQQLVELDRLPEGAKEGDCLEIDQGGQITINQRETQQRREEAARLLKSLLKR